MKNTFYKQKMNNVKQRAANPFAFCILHFTFYILFTTTTFAQIPLPEHPRPDFERNEWVNLNGKWDFSFDKADVGLKQGWPLGKTPFKHKINVPFSWGAALSGVKDSADIAWYSRKIQIPAHWSNRRVFVVIGASDYKTTLWLDGKELGSHEGGYVPFEFELNAKAGATHTLVVRVDDVRRDYALYGKQGYGNARGMWQTVYLEARANEYLEALHFTPDIDNRKVTATAYLPKPAQQDLQLKLTMSAMRPSTLPVQTIKKGQDKFTFTFDVPNAKLWTLENPFLYDVNVQLTPNNSSVGDRFRTYFGMRKISVMNLPNTNHAYVALNNKPIYLQLALDQSYHPDGFYTFPSDAFMKQEIQMAKDIGLNGIRTHIKIDIPRKLYWADRLGLLVMSDLPNFWGQPTPEARQESERNLPKLIKRDFNHPAIFSWVIFNEQWGLSTKVEENGKKVNRYLPETQQWVASMYHKAKALDPTRLVEDNSPCCGGGHTETDINSWHEYQPGYAWEELFKNISAKTFDGSTWNFEKGFAQGHQPNINSEFGNVWGYDGSTGDVDWSFDYHKAINTYRRYPAIAGWLYTEHHDVINEWNGYWKFDRSQKFTGLDGMVDGMSIRDFHSPIYLSTDQNITKSVRPNEMVEVPLTISAMTGRNDLGNELNLRVELKGSDVLGNDKKWQTYNLKIPYRPWIQQSLPPLQVLMPAEKALATLSLVVTDKKGNVLARNFNNYIVEAPTPTTFEGKRLISIDPKTFSDAKWSLKQWNVLDGLKVNGAGSGYFEYKIKWPADIAPDKLTKVEFMMEASSKPLLGKDQDNAQKMNGDYMLGGGTFDNSRNPNAYPMTDEQTNKSAVKFSFNGIDAGKLDISDDPADHRGVLSWHYQPQDRKLREAGTYGYKLVVTVPPAAIAQAAKTGEMVLRLAVGNGSGLAIYSDKFGMFVMNPTFVIHEK